MMPSYEALDRACRIMAAVVLFPPVYLAVWMVCRAVDWPKPSVMD